MDLDRKHGSGTPSCEQDDIWADVAYWALVLALMAVTIGLAPGILEDLWGWGAA